MLSNGGCPKTMLSIKDALEALESVGGKVEIINFIFIVGRFNAI